MKNTQKVFRVNASTF